MFVAESLADLLASSSMNSLAPLRRILQASGSQKENGEQSPARAALQSLWPGLARCASFDENEVVVTNALVDDLNTAHLLDSSRGRGGMCPQASSAEPA